MATLVAGIQYGLSSQIDVHENKTLIFVKLTDSASRAIDDYLQNQYELDHKPTIQFLGNKGQLNFPFTNHRELKGSSRFTFSLSGNKDIEGSQGGFDCVQQTGPRSLESFGTLPFKMRIQANDDVYERTKHRMAVVEENNKTKCTRMIKPNTIDLGKKLNSKGYNKTNPLLNNSSSINLRHETLKEGNDITCKTVLPEELCVSSTSPVSKTSQNQMKLKSNDITRRPIKERLIHLLALRPFKKPEIYERISREGVKEKEKNVVSAMLKQIAFVRDNAYNLHRWVWNDVQEDWSFYSEQEKAILKKQRPQNLTPPGSTDSCSSASSKSPNSTYYDSPTSIPASSTDALGSKRSGYFLNVDDINTKRPRISHHFKNMSNIESTLQVSIDYHNSKIEDENSLKSVIPDQEKFNNDVNLLNYEAPIEIKKISNTDDYLKYYTKICSSEQRTQYKAEFNAFYEEYKALHLETVKISDHFKLMEEQLKKEFELKNITKYEAIKKEILEKYKKSKSVHIQFNSLHNKLGYIKKLVAEYDLQVNQQILKKDLVPDENNRLQQINDNQERCLKEKLPQQVLPPHSYTMAQISS